jgi:hypothetical protein
MFAGALYSSHLCIGCPCHLGLDGFVLSLAALLGGWAAGAAGAAGWMAAVNAHVLECPFGIPIQNRTFHTLASIQRSVRLGSR